MIDDAGSAIFKAIAAAGLAAAWAGSAAAQPAPQGWQVSNSVSQLTEAASVTARLPSSQPLLDMIDQPERAALVLRCSDRQLAAYVAWPQVLAVDSSGELFGTTQTMVIWRVDANPIRVNYWDRSSEGTAAGKFGTGGALKIMRSLASAKRLVVRMTGRITQEAVFDLGEADPVIAQVEQACGTTPGGR